MTNSKENNLLFRRFVLLTICIGFIGVLMAQALVTVHKQDNSFKVHNRPAQWDTLSDLPVCGEKHCSNWELQTIAS